MKKFDKIIYDNNKEGRLLSSDLTEQGLFFYIEDLTTHTMYIRALDEIQFEE